MLNVIRVSKSFDNKRVLDGVSFSVGDGEIYGLVGKNGAGKTTLMTIVAGLLKADAGECIIRGSDDLNHNIGYLPDMPVFFDYLSSKEYLDFLLMSTVSVKKRREELLQIVGLQGDEKIGVMSRGMKQRLGVAAALVTNPKVLLLDEPTSALDPLGRHELMGILSSLRAEGKSIVLSTHILADMEKICDRVGFLHGGIIKKEVVMKDFLAGYQNSWEINFDKAVDGIPYDNTIMSIDYTGEGRYVFKTKNQKYLLKYLENFPGNILTIRNKTMSLDELFEEVCE